MEKSDVVILVSVAGLLTVVFGGFLLPEQHPFELRTDETTVTNVEFEGTSGSESNSVVLYVENRNKVMDLVVKQVQVLSDGFNRTLSIKPEESNYPTGSQGQITLTDVGWTKDI
jgi:hypothetical protein